MKKIFRITIGIIVVIPFVLLVHLFSIFIGKERALKCSGKFATSFAKLLVKLSLPNIRNASEFYKFKSKLKVRLKLWKLLYDLSVEYPDDDTIKLNITNFPFCEALDKLQLPELKPFICQGDLEVAKENENKWEFERIHQIGTGDKFCDHTYERKIS